MAIMLTVFGVGFVIFVMCVLGLRFWLNGGLYRRNCKHIKVKLDGKTTVITGGNSGIGKETAIDLARRGARVIIACRNVKKAEEAVREIQRRSGSSNVTYRQLELSDQASVRRFAEEYIKEEPRLDYLINNAGIARAQKGHRTAEGYNLVFATNHFGHFLLTTLLLDLLKKSSSSRIINVSSIAHVQVKPGEMTFEKKDSEGRVYPALRMYPRSKLANILFTKELARQLEGTGVSTFALHPGAITTELVGKSVEEAGSGIFVRYLSFAMFWLLGSDAESGAQTTLYCTLEESLPKLSGSYFDNCCLTKETDVARDEGLAKKLWEVSLQATGLD